MHSVSDPDFEACSAGDDEACKRFVRWYQQNKARLTRSLLDAVIDAYRAGRFTLREILIDVYKRQDYEPALFALVDTHAEDDRALVFVLEHFERTLIEPIARRVAQKVSLPTEEAQSHLISEGKLILWDLIQGKTPHDPAKGRFEVRLWDLLDKRLREKVIPLNQVTMPDSVYLRHWSIVHNCVEELSGEYHQWPPIEKLIDCFLRNQEDITKRETARVRVLDVLNFSPPGILEEEKIPAPESDRPKGDSSENDQTERETAGMQRFRDIEMCLGDSVVAKKWVILTLLKTHYPNEHSNAWIADVLRDPKAAIENVKEGNLNFRTWKELLQNLGLTRCLPTTWQEVYKLFRSGKPGLEYEQPEDDENKKAEKRQKTVNRIKNWKSPRNKKVAKCQEKWRVDDTSPWMA